jgi:hypothetical protein
LLGRRCAGGRPYKTISADVLWNRAGSSGLDNDCISESVQSRKSIALRVAWYVSD